MSEFAVVVLYPLWAVSVLVAVNALRLGRQRAPGLVTLSLALSLWVTALILLQHPATRSFAEHVIPSGMFLAAGFLHAGAELGQAGDRRLVFAAYVLSALVAGVGAWNPHLVFRPGLSGPGPLFWPLGVLAAIGSIATSLRMLRPLAGTDAETNSRRRQVGVAAALAALGGGASLAAHLLFRWPMEWAALPLIGAVLLVARALVRGEVGRGGALVRSGLVQGLLTAAVSGVGLVAFIELLPALTPAGSGRGWLVAVVFLAALPLDAIRQYTVETIGRRWLGLRMGPRELSLEAEAHEARAEHAERLAEIGALASAVAHEVRNPLGVIAAQAKLLELEGADPESVATLREQVARGSRFVDDLLSYARPRPLRIRRFQPKHELEAIWQALTKSLGAAGTPPPPLALDLDELITAEGDADGFRDVCTALLHNAVAALSGRPDPLLRVTAETRGRALRLHIEDNGPGVPEDLRERLFEPFVSGRGRDSAFVGTGLGLAICRRWVERHGGAIHHEVVATGGARFVVAWPLRMPEAPHG